MSHSILFIFGFAGAGMILLVVFYTSSVYRGKRGETYSPLNHFISELGEVGVSRAAWAFNLGLLISGLLFLPVIIRLGITLGSVLGWLGTAAGILAVLSVTAVGIFPMNALKPHVIAATTYFRSGLVMVFFFGLAILLQPAGRVVIPKAAAFLSLLAFLSYAAFLTLPLFEKPSQEPTNALDPEQVHERPRVWALPLLEWLVFLSAVTWLFGMTFFI